MSYDVISVILLSPLNLVTFVTYIFVKNARENIFPMNLSAGTWNCRNFFRMSYAVISVRLLSPQGTVMFVTCIFVKNAWENISLMNLKNT